MTTSPLQAKKFSPILKRFFTQLWQVSASSGGSPWEAGFGEKTRYISRTDEKSPAQLTPISKDFPVLSVLVMRSRFIINWINRIYSTASKKAISHEIGFQQGF
jgi:hypothetical protein